MGNVIKSLFKMLQPGHLRDVPAAPQPPRMIPGAQAAKELVMLPMDMLPPAARMPKSRNHSADAMLYLRDSHRMNPSGKRVVQVKADGIRAIYIDGTIYSREGMPLDCALHCTPGLQRMEKQMLDSGIIAGPVVFDGEYQAVGGFADTLTEMKRGEGEGVFWAFDALPLDAWRKGGFDAPIQSRLAMLKMAVMEHNTSEFVGMLDWWELTAEETWAKAREIWAAGGEGIVSKRMGSPYVRDRSSDWLRIKQTHTVDGIIVDMMPRADGTLKAMTVRVEAGRKGEEVPQTVIVGTGWTKEEGRTLLAMHTGALVDSPIWAEISFQMTTGNKRTVRGAKFHRIRSAKS